MEQRDGFLTMDFTDFRGYQRSIRVIRVIRGCNCRLENDC
jgi:hypothetical protein